MKKRGFSLLELIVSSSLFLLLFGMIFVVFTDGSRGFQQAVLRQDLQGDLMNLSARLRQDVRLSDFNSANLVGRTVTRSDGVDVSRDGLAFAALSDWDDPTNYDAVTGLPDWNRYTVYYATDSGNLGKVYRQVVDSGGSTGGGPYLALPGNLGDDPTLNQDVISTNHLSDMVETFEVALEGGIQAISVRVVLRRRGTQRTGGAGERVDESLEASYSFAPRNTFPRL